MFWKKRSAEEKQQRRDKALAGYKERVARALTVADVGEKYAALRKINREIEKKFVRTRKVARRTLARKYGFVIIAPPAIATISALLVPIIGRAAFAISVTLAWIGGARGVNKAEKPAAEVPYKVYKSKRDAESLPFRDLQKTIAGHASDAVNKASAAELSASSRRRLLARKSPEARKRIKEHFNAQAAAKKAAKKAPKPGNAPQPPQNKQG
jgi:hypothetical protein